MAVQVFTIYSLQQHVDLDEFIEWSREVDQPACRQLPICEAFDVHLARGGTRELETPLVIESAVVESWDAWDKATSGPGHAHVVESWERFGDPSTSLTVWCEKI